MTHIVGMPYPEGSSEPTVGIEYDVEQSQAVLYVDEGQGCTDFPLSYEQVSVLKGLCSSIIAQMEWHDATWLYASEGLSGSTKHLIKKGEQQHKTGEKVLCGLLPIGIAKVCGGWELSPVRGEVKQTGGICKSCWKVFEKEEWTNQRATLLNDSEHG